MIVLRVLGLWACLCAVAAIACVVLYAVGLSVYVLAVSLPPTAAIAVGGVALGLLVAAIMAVAIDDEEDDTPS